MISLAKFKSASIEGGKRIIKSLTMGGAATAKEAYPFGIDSQPPEGCTAIYADTSNIDEAVIIGYINKNQLAEPGSSRIYAIGSSGEVSGFLYARASGVLELNGNQFSSVRFQNLKTAIDSNDALINAELAKIATAIETLGGTYVPANVSTNMISSESPTVKLK